MVAMPVEKVFVKKHGLAKRAWRFAAFTIKARPLRAKLRQTIKGIQGREKELSALRKEQALLASQKEQNEKTKAQLQLLAQRIMYGEEAINELKTIKAGLEEQIEWIRKKQ